MDAFVQKKLQVEVGWQQRSEGKFKYHGGIVFNVLHVCLGNDSVKKLNPKVCSTFI